MKTGKKVKYQQKSNCKLLYWLKLH